MPQRRPSEPPLPSRHGPRDPWAEPSATGDAGDPVDTDDCKGPRGSADPAAAAPGGPVRLDKWLWVARFFKTRSLAADAIGRGQVRVNGSPAKASRDLRPGDEVAFRHAGVERTVEVLGLSLQRGSAPIAQTLYRETAASVQAREAQAALRRMGTEPALAQPEGRPTKRDRRALADWNRWSVSIDDLPPGR